MLMLVMPVVVTVVVIMMVVVVLCVCVCVIYNFGKRGLTVMPGLALNSWAQPTFLLQFITHLGLQAYLIKPSLRV